MSTKTGSLVRRGPPGDPVSGFTLTTFLPYRLNVLASVVSEALAGTYAARFGIAVPEWRVLATVGEFGRVTAKAIGLHAQMSKVKVSRAVAALEARGFLARCPNRDDRREAHLALTPAGAEVYRQIIPLARAFATELTAELSCDEVAALDALLDRLLGRARALHAPTAGRT